MQEHFLSVCVMVLYATLDQISAKCHAALLQDCIYTFSHTHTQMDVMAQGNPNIIKSMKVGRAGDLCFTQQTLGTYLTIFLFLNKWAMLQKSYLMGVSLLCLCRVACYISHLIQKDTKKLTLRWSLKSGNSNAKAIDPSSVVSVLK